MIWLLDAVLAIGATVFFVWDERRRRRARALRAYRIRELEWETGVEPRREDLLYEALAKVTGSCEITMGPGVAIPVNGDPRDLLGWVDVDGARCVCVHPDGLTFDRAPTWRPYPVGGEWLADPEEVR